MEGKMMSVKEVKAAILKEIEAERKLAAPELVDEPFIKAEEAFNQLAEFDVTKESIGTTVGAMRDFLNHLFEILTKETLDTLKRTEEENKETEKKKAEWQALPDLLRKEGEEEEFVFKDPVEIMEKDLKLTFERAEEDVTEKLTQFLDDRIHADRNSLVREKKKAKKQLFVARETTEVFRRSYDESARARQAEELRVVDERWTKKFDAEVGEMTDKVEHLEFQRRLLTQTVKTRDEKVHELSELVADQKFQLKEMKTKLDTAKKQKGGGGGGGRSYGGSTGFGHGHGHAAGGGSHAPSSSGPNHAPWNPNHHAPSLLSTTPSTIARVAEGKQVGDSSKGVVMAEGMDSDPAAAAAAVATAAATATNPSDDYKASSDASATPTDAAASSGAVGVEIGTQTESSPLSDNDTSIDGKDAEVVVENKEEAAEASADPLIADVKQSMKEAKGMLEAAAGKDDAAADGDEGKGVPAAADDKGDDKQQPQEEKRRAPESEAYSIEENNEDDKSSTSSPARGLTRQDTANSILTTASSPGQYDHTCADCSEMRGEIKRLRAKLVDMMENHRADSPTPMITSPMGSVGGRKVSLGSNPGANSEALSTVGAGVTNGSNLESWSAVSPMKVNVHGSAILGAQESIESAGAGVAGTGTEDNDEKSKNGGNSGQQQQQHGSVSVSQPGRGLIISSTMGGIEGEQGSLDLMSGYGLSQEHSHTGGDPDGDGTAGGDNMTLASHESRQSTHETLLADMRVGMVGDNILQSYGSCNDLVGGEGEVGSIQRQISDLQRALMEQLKKDAAMTEKLEWSEKQSQSLGKQLVDADRARKESEKLHSLQMLERGILLKELSQQITDMRSQMQHLQLAHKKAARAHLREMAMLKAGSRVGSAVTMTDSSRVSTAEQRAAKTPVQVPMASVSVDQGFGKEHEHKPIAAVTNGDTAVVVDPTKSSSRMLQASSSMPLLSDEYGNYHTTGKSVKPNPGRLSPVFKLRGRLGESTEFTLNDLDKDSRRTVRNEAASYMETEKMEQLRAVRGQIVGMLSERYPPEKRQEQMLAVDKARTRALKSRETQLAEKVVKKKILFLI